MKEEEEEAARTWHSPIPRRPASCTGRDPGPPELALRGSGSGPIARLRRAWICDTPEVAGSNPALGRLEAC